jgi:hypothetical protein
MRTDCTIDKRQVRCPNACTIGYGKWRAQVGDLLTFQDGAQIRCGRMIGRVHYAPAISGETHPVRDYILVVGLSTALDHTFERWVNPVDVTYVSSSPCLNHSISGY